MDESNKNGSPADDCTLSRTPENSAPDRRRRRFLPLVAAGVVTTSLPSEWRKPVIDAVLLPAHAQTSIPIGDPQWSLVDLRTVLAVPSGETVPVETFSRLRLSACDLPAATTLTVDVFAEITPSGEIQIISGASVPTGTGTISSFINVDSGTVIVTSIVDAFRFELTVDGSTFTYSANAAAIGAAAAGTALPASC